MTSDQVNREMIEFRRRLGAVLERYRAGERSALYLEMLALTDEVVCLADEAPRTKRRVISRLADRCETLLKSLAN